MDLDAFAEGKKRFTDALDNDLNTSLAVTALYDVFKMNANDATKLALVRDFERVLDLGLIEAAEKLNSADTSAPEADSELAAYVEERIAARAQAKKDKNYALADEIRAELSAKGITLIDTKEGTKYTIAE